MQKKKWVRVGLSAVVLAGAFGGVTAAGCGGDDDSTGPKSDSGTPDNSVGETSTTDSPHNDGPAVEAGGGGDGGDGGPSIPNAKVFLVHAATDPLAPPLRFCFGINTSGDGGGTVTVADNIAPFPDFVTVPGSPVAGLLPGFGGSTASSPKLASINLSTLNITLFALDATKIANDTADGGPDGGAEVPCEGLVGTDGKGAGGSGGGTLTLGTDYWNLGTIAAGKLLPGTTWVAAVTGCVAGEPGPTGPTAPNSALCNGGPLAPYSATTGNLTLQSWQVDSTTTVPTTADGGSQLGAQFINASSGWDVVAQSFLATSAGNIGTGAGFWMLTPPAGGADAGDDGGPAFAFTPINCSLTGCAGAFEC